jgi:hypothetical protein
MPPAHVASNPRARAASVRRFPPLACALALIAFAVDAGCFAAIDESRIPGANGGDAAAAQDASNVGAYLGVPCGTVACTPPVSVCCTDTFGDTDYRKGSCSTRDNCGTGDYFACVDDRDCRYAGSAGPYCCVVRLKGGAFTQTACQSDCGTADVLCSPGGIACPSAEVCRASLEFPVLFTCAAP